MSEAVSTGSAASLDVLSRLAKTKVRAGNRIKYLELGGSKNVMVWSL